MLHGRELRIEAGSQCRDARIGKNCEIKESGRCQKDFAALEMVHLMDETVVGWHEWGIRRRCHG